MFQECRSTFHVWKCDFLLLELSGEYFKKQWPKWGAGSRSEAQVCPLGDAQCVCAENPDVQLAPSWSIAYVLSWHFNIFLKKLSIWERKRNIDLYLLMHSLAASYMCPEQGLNGNLGELGWCSNQLCFPARALSWHLFQNKRKFTANVSFKYSNSTEVFIILLSIMPPLYFLNISVKIRHMFSHFTFLSPTVERAFVNLALLMASPH